MSQALGASLQANALEVRESEVMGALIIYGRLHQDSRGQFGEAYREDLFKKYSLPTDWLQDNFSVSGLKVVRGLHIQKHNPQGKLVRCLRGTVYDVWVDVRKESATFGQWESEILTDSMNKAVYVPPGCAHGFMSLTEGSVITYKCTSLFDPQSDGGIVWNDPDIGIEWPKLDDDDVSLSEKDKRLPSLKEFMRTWR